MAGEETEKKDEETSNSVTSDSDVDITGSKLINNGLLCSVLCAMSNALNAEDLIARVDRDCDMEEILEARKKLFSYFNNVTCSEQNKPILNINRLTKKRYVKDIVDQMMKVDKVTEAKLFCMPFDYVREPFLGESDKVVSEVQKEINNEFDLKINALETRMNAKQRALHDSIIDSVNKALAASFEQKNTYANVLSGTVPQVVAPPRIEINSVTANVHKDANLSIPAGDLRSNGHRHRGQRGHSFTGNPTNRERSPSIKRLRDNDGLPIDTSNNNRSNSKPPKRPCIVGTINNSVQTSRKMRSPPADIFVWGVHPDTTKEDIVADLADSSIIITENDIEKKSKNEAFLVSYKIRVKAEDLQKALNPAIWPLRVKVREYVYYSNKKQEKKNSDQNVANAGPNSDNENSGSSVGSGQSMDQGGLLAVQNRYDALDRDVGTASKV